MWTCLKCSENIPWMRATQDSVLRLNENVTSSHDEHRPFNMGSASSETITRRAFVTPTVSHRSEPNASPVEILLTHYQTFVSLDRPIRAGYTLSASNRLRPPALFIREAQVLRLP